MRALDSKVLLRYLIADDPSQAAIADRIVEECGAADEQLFITVLVLCEQTVRVLDRLYRQLKAQIIAAIEPLLEMDLLRFEHDRSARRAFDQFRRSKADFPDYLIGAIATAGCRDTLTFDKALRGSPGFTIL